MAAIAVEVLKFPQVAVTAGEGAGFLAGHLAADSIAAIGDEVNDVALLQQAGCGVAMGNAINAVKEAADYHTLDCEHHGVAHAIDQLLSGAWDG